MKRAGVILVALVVLAVFAAGTAWRRSGWSIQKRPNVVLILIDTLRRDHVGAYGYRRPTTPAVDALAGEGVTFQNAWANSDWTKPSVASLLTGLYVSQHGVVHVLTSVAGEPPATQRLPDGVTTLAKAIKAADYTTVGIVDNVHISGKLGFSQGFDVWHDGCHGATVVTNEALDQLAKVRGPFFFYVHYFDAHAPYKATRYFEGRGRITPAPPDAPSEDYAWSTYTNGVDCGLIGLSPIERERLIDLYDGDVRAVDAGIARIVRTLRDKGLYDNAWIIVTADHGENFYENRRLTHPHDCFSNPQMRVPLVMKMPKGLGVGEMAVPDQVELVDIAPTILSHVGAAVPAGMVGVNLMPAITQKKPLPVRSIPAESESGRMLLAEGSKYVDVPTKAGEFQFVYDERRDPLEEHNLAAGDPQSVAALRSRFDDLASDARRRLTLKTQSGVPLSREEVERMRTLGYIH